MRKILFIAASFIMAIPAWAGDLPVDARIERAMLGDHRSQENIDRNRYRHPVGTLTFLGLGTGLDSVSWGAMLQQGKVHAWTGAWHLWAFPAIALAITVVALHAVGDTAD